MRYSKLFGKTNKKAKKFKSVNATLLQKAGFVDQIMSGVYTYLPLGQRVLNKIENIIRDEMNTIGQEIFMPSIMPRELWEKTDRIDSVDILFKVIAGNEESKKKNDADYILGCTHEEVVTPLAQKYTFSYKDLPFALYQIQTKFRNEARPKSGLLRGREFRMKDLYSFHSSEEDFRKYYEKCKEVYMRIYNRIGIGDSTVIAVAAGGDFTSEFTHEFQTKCDTGEDTIFYSESSDTYYNREVAPSLAVSMQDESETARKMQSILGEGMIGVEALADYLEIPVSKTTKTLLFIDENDKIYAAAVRGDYEINEMKLKSMLGVKKLLLAPEEIVEKTTGATVGYAGLINLPDDVIVVMDDSMKGRINFEMGANKTNYHNINVNFGADLDRPERFYDIKVAKTGDLDPETGEKYKVFNGSEVGNIFPIMDKYSKAFDFNFVDKDGKKKPVIMGCYGIGSSRIMGVLVEKYHDNKGIIWPDNVSPYKVHIITMPNKKSIELGKYIYDKLNNTLKDEVLLDDRENVTFGEKLSDADLIGCPKQVILGNKSSKAKVEVKDRKTGEVVFISVTDLITGLNK